MSTFFDARILADYVSNHPQFELCAREGPVYDHMGAITADAVLQAGINYRSVVKPRIDFILNEYRWCPTLPDFAAVLQRHGAKKVLRWSHPEKPRRLNALVDLLLSVDISETNDLVGWLEASQNREKLLKINGIGPKTVDYLSVLVGLPFVAVDRHIRSFVRGAGIQASNYEDVRELIIVTAELLSLPVTTLDCSIWNHQSKRRKGSRFKLDGHRRIKEASANNGSRSAPHMVLRGEANFDMLDEWAVKPRMGEHACFRQANDNRQDR